MSLEVSILISFSLRLYLLHSVAISERRKPLMLFSGFDWLLYQFATFPFCLISSSCNFQPYYIDQGHHHNGDQAAGRSHISCSICGRQFGDLIYAVRLFRASLSSQSKCILLTGFASLQPFGWNLNGGFSASGLRDLGGGGRRLAIGQVDTQPLGSYCLPIDTYGLNLTATELLNWLQRRFQLSTHPANPDAVTFAAWKATALLSGKKCVMSCDIIEIRVIFRRIQMIVE